MHNLIKVAILLILPFSMFGQINYLKHYSNQGYDAGQGIVQLEDSGYVMCGLSSSFIDGNSQAFMLRVDSLGNYMWSTKYGGMESESARRVLYKKNFGFFLTGFTNSMGNGSYDFYLIKTDESGNLEWEKTYGTSGWEKVNDAALTRDTGVIMVGETNSNIATGVDMYIVRTDINGDTLWTKTFGGVGPDKANCIERYNDSLFVIGGNMWVEDSLLTKAALIYIKDDGTVLDINILNSGNGNYELNDIEIVNDSVQGIGGRRLNESEFWRITMYVFKMNPTTISTIGYYFTVNLGDFWGETISTYGNNGRRYVGLGAENNVNVSPFGPDLLIARYSAAMNWQAQVVQLFGDYPDASGEIIPTSDGGAAVVGYRDGIGEGGGSVFLLKIGQNETYPTTLNVTFYSDLVSVDPIVLMEGVEIYPNPTMQAVTINLAAQQSYDIHISNALGQILKIVNVSGKESVDLSGLSAGIYTLIFNEGGIPVGSYRLVVQ